MYVCMYVPWVATPTEAPPPPFPASQHCSILLAEFNMSMYVCMYVPWVATPTEAPAPLPRLAASVIRELKQQRF